MTIFGVFTMKEEVFYGKGMGKLKDWITRLKS